MENLDKFFTLKEVYTLYKLVNKEIENQNENLEYYKNKKNYKTIFVENYIERLKVLKTKLEEI